jgi:hypothetical protein
MRVTAPILGILAEGLLLERIDLIPDETGDGEHGPWCPLEMDPCFV